MKKLIDENKIQGVYEFITQYVAENGYAPSVREVCRGCNIKSTATAYVIINKLNDKGLISKTNKRTRAISLNQNVTTVPLVGTVAAGTPIFAEENLEGKFSIPSDFFNGDNLFMLTVQGDSMIKIGMFNGDKIIVERQNTADDGDIVVALIDDSATVKRFYRKNNKFILHPENDDMEDFVFDEVEILGKVIGLMRNI